MIAVLIGLAALTLFFTLFLGPGLLAIVFLLALAALGVQQLLQRDRQHAAIQEAIAHGAPEPIAAWGKVAEVAGDCPDGQALRKGTTFVVADGRVWPSLCQHADRAIIDALERMDVHDQSEAPARYHDATHQVELEVYRAAPMPHAAVSAAPEARPVAAEAESEPLIPLPPFQPGWLPRAMISAFMATILMSVMFFAAFAGARLLAFMIPAAGAGATLREWLVALTTNRVLDLATSSLYLAGAAHLIMGVLWGLAYAWFFEPRLSGPSWRKGLEFSLLPWALSLVVFLPLVGGGVLGTSLGAGPLPVIGNLVLHLVYGLSLGALYGPLGDIPADQFPRTRETDSARTIGHEEQAMARGIGIGAGLGALIGVVGAVTAGTGPTSTILGAPPLAFLAVSVLLGATFGCFVGSMTGLAPREPGHRIGMS